MKKIYAYHGTLSNTTFEDLSFDYSSDEMLGIHFGTKRAAVERIEQYNPNAADLSDEEVNEIFENKPEAFISVAIAATKIYGTVSESDLSGLNRQELIEQGYDCIAYVNDVEDIGSISYIVLDMSIAEETI